MGNSTPKDREKILIEELKILQGVINRMVQNSFRVQEMDTRARCWGFIP
ncbi:hypothetical protein ID0992_13550 [Helicobacter pylori]